MRRLAAIVFLLCAASLAAQADPVRTSKWHGFPRLDLVVDGRKCILVVPAKAAAGRPWIWRARFFGHQPGADRALLARGYHVAYCDVAGLFGAPQAVAHWNAFYTLAVETFQLARRVALEGMSRGGLIIYNWAVANPDKVACIYGDAPVCDFKSWPGGKGKGKGSPADWQRCLRIYGLTEDSALTYRKNPIDQLASLATAKIPLLHVIGDADPVVPIAENTAILAARYRKLGGTIHVVAKSGVGHHPHALKNPRPIVEFVVGSCRAAGADQTRPPLFEDNLQSRAGLRNSRCVFETTGRGHVAFMGGSITEMNGFRPMVCNILRHTYPNTKFEFTAAGIASTCSTTGAFRLERDVLKKGPVDLFLVEFAVNDDQDAAHARDECIRGMEGIVRQIRRHNPNADIVVVHFVNPRMLATCMRGDLPLTIEAHEAVASHYGVASAILTREVAERILRGELTWREFGGTHPKKSGNVLAAQMIGQLFRRGWTGPALAKPAAHAAPDPIANTSYGLGAFLPIRRAKLVNGWQVHVPNWSHLPGGKRRRFTAVDMLCASEPGAELTLSFRGTAVGAYVCAGPDAGLLEGSIDGKPFAPVDLFHRFSRGLHYPRTVMFATDLTPGDHELVLRVADATKSKGHAARIMEFTVNGVR